MSLSFKQQSAKELRISGIVQGVGFRPFVFQLAETHGLAGDIVNTNEGVRIHIEGPGDAVDAFVRDIRSLTPPLACITDIKSESIPPTGRSGFAIKPSVGLQQARATLISPDVSVCSDCLRELDDPNDRRYRYPFINCTNCGPRYTIIDDIPYDRPNTAMKGFRMCAACQAEYDNPRDRRFHAQPNACPECGPRLSLSDRNGTPLPGGDPVSRTAELLRAGSIVAVKGLGGFHLAVDAENEAAVIRLRKRKHREEKPFALMAPDTDMVRDFAELSETEEDLLTGITRPIVLLAKRRPHALASQVAPRNRYFGVMLPYTPLHYLLLRQGFRALVMTSGNLSEEPIAIDNNEAFTRLAPIADYFLIHDRDIYLRSDDSIVRQIGGRIQFIRRSRGYVPAPVFLKESGPRVLAVGGELKNTICLTKGDQAFVSQHIGDMENAATETFFETTIKRLRRLLDVEPEVVAHDLHPDYRSTRYAERVKSRRTIGVQHHHAHIAACMAENRIDGPLIGLALDGTGFGTDRTIWGGEVLIADFTDFERAAHLACIPMPGGAAAIKEPWRMAVAYLYQTFGGAGRALPIALPGTIPQKNIDLVTQMAAKRINSPLTSSLGRLFDAVAAMVGLRDTVRFEGQAAMELEMIAADIETAPYPYHWTATRPRRIDTAEIITGIAADLGQGTSAAIISAKFHQTLIHLFTDLCDTLRRETGLDRVVLSGGVFQNRILLEGLMEHLAEKKLTVYTHTRVPCNDGGLALGQAVIARAKLTAGIE